MLVLESPASSQGFLPNTGLPGGFLQQDEAARAGLLVQHTLALTFRDDREATCVLSFAF